LYNVSLYFSVKSLKDIKSKSYPATKRPYFVTSMPFFQESATKRS
jgi:hypothetical protein